MISSILQAGTGQVFIPLIFILLFWDISLHQRQLIDFPWSLSRSKSLQVSRTLLSIPVDLNNAVVWMASTRPLIFMSPGPSTSPLMTVPSGSVTTGITVTFRFHSCFNSLPRSSTYLSFRFLSTLLSGMSEQQSPWFLKLIITLIITRSGRLAKIRWSVCISKSQTSFCVSFYWRGSGGALSLLL